MAKQAGYFVVGNGFGGYDLVDELELAFVVDCVWRRDAVTHCDAEDVVVIL